MNLRSKSIILGLILLSGTGCGHEIEPFGQGSLGLDWEVAPMGCEASGIEVVEVVLANDLRTYERRFDCEAPPISMSAIKPGTYRLSINGLDSDNRATFGASISDLLIRPDERLEIGHVDLSALPSRAEVGWYFENQRVCGTNGVDDVELTVYDSAYYEVFRSSTRCDAGLLAVDGLHSGSYFFRVRAQGDAERYEGISEEVLKRGSETFVEVALIEIGP